MKQEWQVTSKDAGRRLDLWLVRQLKASRGKVKELIDQGLVAVNKRRVRIAGWELKPGDRISVQQLKPRGKAARRGGFVRVLYEDRDLIAVDKPAGLLVVPAPDGSGETVVDQVKAYLRRKYRDAKGGFVEPLHRLDAETSGVVLLAKSREGQALEKAFRTHATTRQYVAIVEGQVEEEEGVVDLPLSKGEFGAGKKVTIVTKGEGMPARTHYRVRERYADATLLDVALETGRTHQIRVHMASIGHPLLGDKVYGRAHGLPRHALHAAELRFRHPVTGKRMICHAPLPKDLKALIDQLRGE